MRHRPASDGAIMNCNMTWQNGSREYLLNKNVFTDTQAQIEASNHQEQIYAKTIRDVVMRVRIQAKLAFAYHFNIIHTGG